MQIFEAEFLLSAILRQDLDYASNWYKYITVCYRYLKVSACTNPRLLNEGTTATVRTVGDAKLSEIRICCIASIKTKMKIGLGLFLMCGWSFVMLNHLDNGH